MLSARIGTLEYYFDIYTDLKAERQALHDAIIQTILDRKEYSKDKNIFMPGGAPANGKSAFIRSGIVEYPPNALKIDPDEIKMMLPEYRSLLNMQEPLAAWLVHDESSHLSKKLRQAAITEGIDLLLDGVANHSIEKRLEDMEALKRKWPLGSHRLCYTRHGPEPKACKDQVPANRSAGSGIFHQGSQSKSSSINPSIN